jgi:hypothetical protein
MTTQTHIFEIISVTIRTFVSIWKLVVLSTLPSFEDKVFIWFCNKLSPFISPPVMYCYNSNNVLLMTSQMTYPYVLYHSTWESTLAQILKSFMLSNLKTTVKYFKEDKTSRRIV